MKTHMLETFKCAIVSTVYGNLVFLYLFVVHPKSRKEPNVKTSLMSMSRSLASKVQLTQEDISRPEVLQLGS